MKSALSPAYREVLETVVKMSDEEYFTFVFTAAARRDGVRVPTVARREKELLKRIQVQPARRTRERLKTLHEANLRGALTASEEQELEMISDALEQHAVDRLRLVSELAVLRGKTLAQTWRALGLSKIALRLNRAPLRNMRGVLMGSGDHPPRSKWV